MIRLSLVVLSLMTVHAWGAAITDDGSKSSGWGWCCWDARSTAAVAPGPISASASKTISMPVPTTGPTTEQLEALNLPVYILDIKSTAWGADTTAFTGVSHEGVVGGLIRSDTPDFTAGGAGAGTDLRRTASIDDADRPAIVESPLPIERRPFITVQKVVDQYIRSVTYALKSQISSILGVPEDVKGDRPNELWRYIGRDLTQYMIEQNLDRKHLKIIENFVKEHLHMHYAKSDRYMPARSHEDRTLSSKRRELWRQYLMLDARISLDAQNNRIAAKALGLLPRG